MKQIQDVLNFTFHLGQDISVSVKAILVIVLVVFVTSRLLKLLSRLVTRKLPLDDKIKFEMLFSYASWVVYLIILLITFHSIGINVTAVFAASAALLIGVGLALQTLIQDIISGVFIIVDQSVHVGDVIEVDNKIGRVEEIKLRTTRAVTLNNRVIIIPNHVFLTSSLYNWTQNGKETKDSVTVGVAYGSDIDLVEKLLLQAVVGHPDILTTPAARVLFMDFGDSALVFRLVFTLRDSFLGEGPKSDVRFKIEKLFREHQVSIPFPQRDLHLVTADGLSTKK
ncbi:mechanosensitive ion channel family protein [Formosa algae]|uniref:Small-conductance mechanosensitive channel n=1 Tax=Formosa algae TaxID=225843 RepID=A0A9X1C8P6_9FLAO|nr:mechanosensitive ion channel domain-containing protein [Formosa algae]MBP1839596.1 small-conductance mechanosensitive channel [Formosa algae]MDQ0334900.1 small-conductance mechanosensitive channel [Formosa algae]OEI80600.1 mechanosensitive ion channel protein MscS [Formosa algae]